MGRKRRIQTDRVISKAVIFTGGVNEGVASLQLKPGELRRCLNYEEIDGPQSGMSSIEGVERFDGQPSPSDIYASFLEDFGNDDKTILLLEADGSNKDKSESKLPVDFTDVLIDPTRSKFSNGSWKFTDTSGRIVVHAGNSIDFSSGEWTIDGWFQFTDQMQEAIILERGNFKLGIFESKLFIEIDTGLQLTSYIDDELTPNRWYEFRVSRKDDYLYLGYSGHGCAKLPDAQITPTTDNIIIGDMPVAPGSTSVISPLYLDSIRISNVCRSLSYYPVWEYEYSGTMPYSQEDFYLFNADDVERETTRGNIQKVPGTGAVLGVHLYKGEAYSIRDKVDDFFDLAGLYKETPSGWEEVPLTLAMFSFVDSDIPDDTISGMSLYDWVVPSRTAEGTVFDYVQESGDSGTGAASGYMTVAFADSTEEVFSSGDKLYVYKNDDANELIGSCTVASDPDYHPLGVSTSSGGVDFVNGRFQNYPPTSPNLESMFFIANTFGAFAWDGEYMHRIRGPKDVTAHPTHIAIFGNRLWLAYKDGGLFYSASGDAGNFGGLYGAGEIFLSDEPTNLTIVSSALIVTTKTYIKVIKHNTNSNDWKIFLIEDFSDNSGALPNTAVSLMGDMYFCDTRGVNTLQSSETFGDFDVGDLRNKAQKTYKENKDHILGAFLQRDKSQYRILFCKKGGGFTKCITITFGEDKAYKQYSKSSARKSVRGVTISGYPMEFTCFHEGRGVDGADKILAGGTDGYVYILDKGTSFDGDFIETELSSAFYHYSSPGNWKRFYSLLFEISSKLGIRLSVKPTFNYMYDHMLDPLEQSVMTYGQGGRWGESDWGYFLWGGSPVNSQMVYILGQGFNMSVTIRSRSKVHPLHVIENMITAYSTGSRYM